MQTIEAIYIYLKKRERERELPSAIGEMVTELREKGRWVGENVICMVCMNLSHLEPVEPSACGADRVYQKQKLGREEVCLWSRPPTLTRRHGEGGEVYAAGVGRLTGWRPCLGGFGMPSWQLSTRNRGVSVVCVCLLPPH